MKYAGTYYAKLKEFNKSQSNMNRLAWFIEKWQNKRIKNQKIGQPFDVSIMFDESLLKNEDFMKLVDEVEDVYDDFCKDTKYYSKIQTALNDYEKYKTFLKDNGISKEEAKNFDINWNYVYQKYYEKCKKITDDRSMLAYACVYLSHIKYKTKNKKFVWKVCPDGLMMNLKEDWEQKIPKRDEENGKYEYLGKHYALMDKKEDWWN